MASPLQPQGVLNRVLGSISVTGITALNITAPFLGKRGISLSFDGPATPFIETLTGGVPSPELYQRATVTAELLKTQALAAAWKAQIESNSVIGDIVVRGDSTTLPPYPITNCGIQSIEALHFNGEEVSYVVTIAGFYVINSSLFN